MVEKTTIILCNNCEGKGVIYCEKLKCYHNGIYDEWSEECPKCKGSGLLKQIEIHSIRYEPFTPYKPQGIDE